MFSGTSYRGKIRLFGIVFVNKIVVNIGVLILSNSRDILVSSFRTSEFGCQEKHDRTLLVSKFSELEVDLESSQCQLCGETCLVWNVPYHLYHF